jgi:hypothetical protein
VSRALLTHPSAAVLGLFLGSLVISGSGLAQPDVVRVERPQRGWRALAGLGIAVGHDYAYQAGLNNLRLFGGSREEKRWFPAAAVVSPVGGVFASRPRAREGEAIRTTGVLRRLGWELRRRVSALIPLTYLTVQDWHPIFHTPVAHLVLHDVVTLSVGHRVVGVQLVMPEAWLPGPLKPTATVFAMHDRLGLSRDRMDRIVRAYHQGRSWIRARVQMPFTAPSRPERSRRRGPLR